MFFQLYVSQFRILFNVSLVCVGVATRWYITYAKYFTFQSFTFRTSDYVNPFKIVIGLTNYITEIAGF